MPKLSIDAQKFYKARIGNIQVVFLTLTTLAPYGLQAILDFSVILAILASFIGVIVTCGLTLYFYSKGLYKSKKNAAYRAIITMVTFLIEIFPEIDLIPADVLDFIAMTILSRIEDQEIAEGKAIEAARIAQEQQMQAARVAEYMERRQQQEYQIAVADDNAAMAADNVVAFRRKTAEHNAEESDEDSEDEPDEFQYAEAA